MSHNSVDILPATNALGMLTSYVYFTFYTCISNEFEVEFNDNKINKSIPYHHGIYITYDVI